VKPCGVLLDEVPLQVEDDSADLVYVLTVYGEGYRLALAADFAGAGTQSGIDCDAA
jgi:hypothetical protein